MSRSSRPPILTLWASAYLGCGLFLLVGLLPQGSASIALLGQLSWLALIGSVPTTLALGAASQTAGASRTAIVASTVAVILFTMAMGWEHTDFLLSGPRWAVHPQRGAVRVGIVAALGLIGAAGWSWLIMGARIESGPRLAVWFTLTIALVGLLTGAIVRYRAYEYSMAQLVFPAGVLCGAMVYLLVRGSSRWPIAVAAAAACFLYAVGSRFDSELVATGRRELIAQSRAGALATLYVLPHFGGEQTWSAAENGCPDARPVLEESPIGIAPQGRRSVIIVTVDALRKDVMGIDVDRRPVTPELARLAKRGVSFESATTTYPATLFAMGSAFTGLSPAELYLSPSLPETIFTRSRNHVDQQLVVLPDVGWFRLPIIEQFLATGVETAFAPTDAAATDVLIARLRTARADDAAVMAWIHYYAPHDPYQPHAAFPFGRGRLNAYLSEVAYFDQQLGRLMQYLDEDGWLEDTLVVFFSDHGEALGEMAYWGHHVYLNGWMVDIPLVLWHAQLPPAQPRVGVSLSDVAPTVLHFLGLPMPSDIAAQSLFTLDPNLPGRPSFSEAFPVRGRQLFDSFRLPALDDATIRARMRGIRVASKGYEPKGAITLDQYRLIHHRGAGTTAFYDHETDPHERSGHGASNHETSDRLRRELVQWERAQLRRIQCRLKLSEERLATPRPE